MGRMLKGSEAPSNAMAVLKSTDWLDEILLLPIGNGPRLKVSLKKNAVK